MNRPHAFPESKPLFVTFNPPAEIPEHLVYDRKTFAHPVFDGPAMKAQRDLQGIQRLNRTWFAGAWNRHGFHEDGIASALRVVRLMNRNKAMEGMRHDAGGQGIEIGIPDDMRASA